MTDWTNQELEAIGTSTELDLASGPDASPAIWTTMWVVRVANELYVRSAHGPSGNWFRRALAAGSGVVCAGGITADVTFAQLSSEAGTHDLIDAAYHSKYDRYGPRIVGSVVGNTAAEVTLRLDRR